MKMDYPGAEHWAEIVGPDGKHFQAFAIFAGGDEWNVPFRAAEPGSYRLLGVENRRGDERHDDALAANSQTELAVGETGTAAPPARQALVEAGDFQTIYAAAEPWCVNDHTLVQGPDKTWHLFGITHPKPLDFFKDPGLRLAHATATTLRQNPWQTQAAAVTVERQEGEYLLWAPYVLRHEGVYYMFVSVGATNSHRYAIHLLTSPDLVSWTRSPDNPMVVDGFDGRDPMVLPWEGQWLMYYTATTTPEGGNHIVACVISQDLKHWGGRRVVFTHPRAGSFGGPTESPFVVRRGDHFYLFVCDNDWTDVYVSFNPFAWSLEQKVGHIHSHASEIVRDTDGSWFITHTGWMSGPVQLAPLHWHDAQDAESASLPPATP
ncbi:MAG TPA: family 43 glycosylhydrolase [Verrucomicrobiae bacterium]|nr:family 43 glycosylhydrolase [Verrucomicrobiae bacterium]